MPILWAIGSLLVGVVAFKAGSRLVDNAQEAHRRGREELGKKAVVVFGAYWEGVAESRVEPYPAEESYWVATGPGIDITGAGGLREAFAWAQGRRVVVIDTGTRKPLFAQSLLTRNPSLAAHSKARALGYKITSGAFQTNKPKGF